MPWPSFSMLVPSPRISKISMTHDTLAIANICSLFGDNYFSALATITIPFEEVQESSVFESVSVVVVGDPLWARFAASKR
jgi:hypothetical protein